MTVTKEELESYKNPGTCSLRSILKYPSSCKHLPAEVSTSESQSEFHLKKKRKTLPFAQLLTNEKSWQELEKINEEAKQKAIAISQRKEQAAQKRAAREEEMVRKKEEAIQKKEERTRKKEEEERAKEERQRVKLLKAQTKQAKTNQKKKNQP